MKQKNAGKARGKMQKKSEEFLEQEGASMEISYEGDAGHRYMRIPAAYEYGSHYAVRMLMENRIDGLLKMQIQTIDNETAFCYDITEYFSVKEYCADREADFLLVDSLYTQLLNMVERGREYLLPDNHYLLSPDTIFLRERRDGLWNVGAGYHIGQHMDWGRQMLTLTEFMMEHVNHKDKRAVQLVYGIYGLLREEGCGLNRIKEYIDTCREVSAEAAQVHILPKELQVPDKEIEEGFDRDLEKIQAANKRNATITVASALGMVAVIAILAFYGNLPFRSLVITALGAIIAEIVICGLLLKD